MVVGVSIGDAAMLLNFLITVYKNVKAAIPGFIELLHQYKLFYRHFLIAFKLAESRHLEKGQRRNADLIFEDCGRLLDELEEFEDEHRSLATKNPRLRDLWKVKPEIVNDLTDKIEARKACLFLFYAEHNSSSLQKVEKSMEKIRKPVVETRDSVGDIKQTMTELQQSQDEMKKCLQFLVSKTVFRLQAASSDFLCTTDSLSTTSTVNWHRIRDELKNKGISSSLLDQYKSQVITQVEGIIFGNSDPDGDARSREPPPSLRLNADIPGKAAENTTTILLEEAEKSNWSEENLQEQPYSRH
ncbi:hypothetical protein BJX70DRAFT_362627 [Aspergillus crustosus]